MVHKPLDYSNFIKNYNKKNIQKISLYFKPFIQNHLKSFEEKFKKTFEIEFSKKQKIFGYLFYSNVQFLNLFGFQKRNLWEKRYLYLYV